MKLTAATVSITATKSTTLDEVVDTIRQRFPTAKFESPRINPPYTTVGFTVEARQFQLKQFGTTVLLQWNPDANGKWWAHMGLDNVAPEYAANFIQQTLEPQSEEAPTPTFNHPIDELQHFLDTDDAEDDGELGDFIAEFLDKYGSRIKPDILQQFLAAWTDEDEFDIPADDAWEQVGHLLLDPKNWLSS